MESGLFKRRLANLPLYAWTLLLVGVLVGVVIGAVLFSATFTARVNVIGVPGTHMTIFDSDSATVLATDERGSVNQLNFGDLLVGSSVRHGIIIKHCQTAASTIPIGDCVATGPPAPNPFYLRATLVAEVFVLFETSTFDGVRVTVEFNPGAICADYGGTPSSDGTVCAIPFDPNVSRAFDAAVQAPRTAAGGERSIEITITAYDVAFEA